MRIGENPNSISFPECWLLRQNNLGDQKMERDLNFTDQSMPALPEGIDIHSG